MKTDSSADLGRPRVIIVRKAPQGIKGGSASPRLGVLGGTFNPITRAHVLLAQRALEAFSLEEVLLVLPQAPPHKAILEADATDRLRMMELAVMEDERLSVAYSSHGLFLEIYQGLEGIYPSTVEVYFITGRDAAERVLTWDYPDPAQALEEMLRHFRLIVANRGGKFQAPPIPLLRKYLDRIHPLELPSEWEGISATLVREKVARGEAITGLVPDAVERFIQERGLYRPLASRP